MSLNSRTAALGAAVLVVLGSAAPLAEAQTRARLSNHPSPLNTVPGIRRASGPRMSLPNIRMGNFGVRAKMPRGIGKVNGTLLPPHDHGPRSHRTEAPDHGFRPLPDGGGLVRGRDGRWYPSPWGVDNGVRIGTGGVDARFTHSGDRWHIAAALGTGIDYSWLTRRHGWRGWNSCWNLCDGVYGGWYTDSWYPSTFAVDNYPVDSFVAFGNPPAPPAPVVDPEEGLAVPERAAKRLREGRPDDAIVLLRSHTEAHPEEMEAARTLAVALLDARRTKEGVAVMALVYERHPELARTPIDAYAVGPRREMRDLLVRVVQYGHRVNSMSAWLTAAVLMQAEGRPDPALRMLDRADALGLDPELSKALRIALRP